LPFINEQGRAVVLYPSYAYPPQQKIIKAKVGLLELAKQLGNVSQACKMLGYSRDSFYRFRAGGFEPPHGGIKIRCLH
jgi:Winged helix-turn helix